MKTVFFIGGNFGDISDLLKSKDLVYLILREKLERKEEGPVSRDEEMEETFALFYI